MDALMLAALLGCPLVATPAAQAGFAWQRSREPAGTCIECGSDPAECWRPFIAEASARFGIPATWIERVMRAESGGRTRFAGRPIRSPRGAIGLMQLMPGTWAEMRRRLGLGDDPDAPRDNILAGSFYLRLMYDRFGYPGLFAAYNAGPARFSAYRAGRARLPGETIAYLSALGTPLAGGADSAALVPPLSPSPSIPPSPSRAPVLPRPPSLFVTVRNSADGPVSSASGGSSAVGAESEGQRETNGDTSGTREAARAARTSQPVLFAIRKGSE